MVLNIPALGSEFTVGLAVVCANVVGLGYLVPDTKVCAKVEVTIGVVTTFIPVGVMIDVGVSLLYAVVGISVGYLISVGVGIFVGDNFEVITALSVEIFVPPIPCETIFVGEIVDVMAPLCVLTEAVGDIGFKARSLV